MKRITLAVLCALLTTNSFAAPVIATEPFVRDAVTQLDAKIATKTDATNVATAEQGAKADTAVQPVTMANEMAKYLPLTGGTLSGSINAGTKTITNLATPTATTDAATKAYVDSAVASSGGGSSGGGSVPSWGTLGAENWANAYWGQTWEVKSTSGAYKLNGLAACLGSAAKNGSVPVSSELGSNCWCKISSANDVTVSASAWVFATTFGNDSTCAMACQNNCAYCVRYSANGNCTRNMLFAN